MSSDELEHLDHDAAAPARPPLANAVVGLAIFFLACVLVVGVAYVFAADLLSPDAPRSAVEREMQRFEAATAADPSDPEPHASYARALVSAGQYDQADDVLAAAVVAMPEEPVLLVEQARVIWARGDDGALVKLEEAYALIDSIRTAYEADLASRGISGDITLPETAAYIEALVLEAAIHEATQDWASVVDATTRALVESPTKADVLAMRGRAYAQMGDADAARADFEAALVFIPDFEPALAGLADMGVTSDGGP